MSKSSATYKDLVTGIYNGNRDAESRFIHEFSRSLIYVIERRCGDKDLARDVCQETFLILLEKFRREMIDEPDKLSIYVHQTAINIFIAGRRKDVRRQTYPDSDFIETYMDGVQTPVNDLEKAHIQKVVRDSILGLKNKRDKDVLYRYYILEHEKDLICQQLDIDFRHFDKVISRARNRLRDVMSDVGNPDSRQKS